MIPSGVPTAPPYSSETVPLEAAELLRVEGLAISFPSPQGEVRAVRGVGFRVARGEAVALVGESGCGKSLTALSVIGLVRPPARRVAGEIRFQGRDTATLSPSELRALRGREIGMIFQEPSASLNPVFTVGYQLGEALARDGRIPRAVIRARAVELLRDVGVPDPEGRLHAYPGELSGGLRQRVMIAIATACRPKLLIADEPTTALDVRVQAQILGLLLRLRRERGMALLLITHDLAVVAQSADRVVVMYSGHCVEEAAVAELFRSPLHPYTRGLLGSMPGHGLVPRKGRLPAIPGSVPSPSKLPSGCPFRDRCSLAVERCAEALPAWEEKLPGHGVRCVRA
ncbi:MAG: ABC transporter ATP-binding protein [Deltaproteobacteria bacterium]|nr:ABC transporter ATP-binding protein [Deltaproteobacteria bacterium]